MEKLAHNLAEQISIHMNYNDDKKSVIAYGLIAIFQIITIMFIVIIIGSIFDFWCESLIIFICVGILRKSTGGVHSQSMYGCILISVLSITILSSLSRYILCFSLNVFINLGLSLLIFILCLAGFYKYVPVDSPKKRILNPDKIKKLRRQSFITLTVLFLVSIILTLISIQINRFDSLATSILLAMIWQLFTLTKTGDWFINKIDLKFKSSDD